MSLLKFPRPSVKYPRNSVKFPRSQRPKHPRMFETDFYRPQTEDILSIMPQLRRIVKRKMATVRSVSSHLNTEDEFMSMAHQAIASVSDRYLVFPNKETFFRLCVASSKNRFNDHVRNMMRHKRWGFEIHLAEENSEVENSTASSEGRGGTRGLQENLVALPAPSEGPTFFERLMKVLSPEDSSVLSEFLESGSFSNFGERFHQAISTPRFCSLRKSILEMLDSGGDSSLLNEYFS